MGEDHVLPPSLALPPALPPQCVGGRTKAVVLGFGQQTIGRGGGGGREGGRGGTPYPYPSSCCCCCCCCCFFLTGTPPSKGRGFVEIDFSGARPGHIDFVKNGAKTEGLREGGREGGRENGSKTKGQKEGGREGGLTCKPDGPVGIQKVGWRVLRKQRHFL